MCVGVSHGITSVLQLPHPGMCFGSLCVAIVCIDPCVCVCVLCLLAVLTCRRRWAYLQQGLGM